MRCCVADAQHDEKHFSCDMNANHNRKQKYFKACAFRPRRNLAVSARDWLREFAYPDPLCFNLIVVFTMFWSFPHAMSQRCLFLPKLRLATR